MPDVKPNFLVVGAAKSGTTSLYQYLRQVPGVFLPKRKEPHYFVAPEVAGRINNIISDADTYFNLFIEGRDSLWRGEMSVCYLYYAEQAIPRILEALGPETKIGIIVRDPVERAYSAYLDVYRHNPDENLTFEQALAMEEVRMMNDSLTPTMYYRDMGLYSRRVEAYMRAFRNVHVMLAEEFVASPSSVVGGFVDFLGGIDVPADLSYDIHNVGGRAWKNRKFAGWIKAAATNRMRVTVRRLMPVAYGQLKSTLFRWMMDRAETMPDGTRKDLVAFYRADVKRLGTLIGRDLSHWLQ